MLKIGEYLSKFKASKTDSTNSADQDKSKVADQAPEVKIKEIRNWYEERYDNITVQRNLLFILLLILLCLSIVSVSVVAYVTNIKRFDPFVIQIDDNTGVARIVNPVDSELLNGNEALAQYFIKKYVVARETYNPVDFSTLARETVRLLSSGNIYRSYRGMLSNEKENPAIKYGQKNTTYFTAKSWSKLNNNKYILRFSIHETEQAKQVFNKIAIVEFHYVPMELNEKDKDINPIGFQVTGYRVDDDNS